jgi:hypothetical protein
MKVLIVDVGDLIRKVTKIGLKAGGYTGIVGGP